MQAISNSDTICAIATPPGAGGIGVVRISGPEAFSILERVWRGRIHPAKFQSRKLYLGEVVSEPGTRNPEPGKAVETRTFHSPGLGSRVSGPGFDDKVLAVKMPAPNTYTGQDVVELSCHGSQVVLDGLVEACRAAGARLAGPGEFTRRAFLAGKMDLAQAEAVCDLIGAAGERAARIAADQLAGQLSEEVRAISSDLSDARGEVEASIDFPDEGVEVSGGELDGRLERISGRIEGLSSTYGVGRVVREGVRVAIVGRPNCGKSSILNRLCGAERALVHGEPGTTRDVVEECVKVSGIAFRLRDTAGMREGGCDVEAMGMERTREEIAAADLALVVLDGSRSLSSEDEAVVEATRGVRRIFVINKSDLPAALDRSGVEDPVVVSAETGDGFSSLKGALAAIALGDGRCLVEGVTVTSARHRDALDSAARALGTAREAYARHEPAECVAQHLRTAHDFLCLITGESVTDGLLDAIFSRFCIGK